MQDDPFRVNRFGPPCGRATYAGLGGGEASGHWPCPLKRGREESPALPEEPYGARDGMLAPPLMPPAESLGQCPPGGPAARRDCAGAIIPFASGTALGLLSGENGSRSTVGLIGFGAGTAFASPVDPINISAPGSETVNTAFSMPDGGILTAMSAYFSLTLPGAAGIDNIIWAQLYISPYPNDSFMPVTAARIRLGTINGADSAGKALHGRVKGLSVSLAPETRLLMVFSNTTAQGTSSAVAGFMSAGLRIRAD